MKKILLVVVCMFCVLVISIKSEAFVVKLSQEAIEQLAKIGKSAGSKELGKEIYKVTKGNVDQMNNMYADVLVSQNRLAASQKEEILQNLSKTKGLNTTLRKMSGRSDVKYVGHRFELLTANELAKNKYNVIELGKKFNDNIKRNATDIDIVAEKNGIVYAFEMKYYSPKNISYNEVINFRADMDSLVAFARETPGCQPVFVINKKPSDPTIAKLIEGAAKQRSVTLIYGEGKQVPIILEMLQ